MHQLEEGEPQSIKRISHYATGVIGDKTVVFPIEVDILNHGTGAVSVDLTNVEYEIAFQTAVRTAAMVASNYTRLSISDKDIIVRIVNDDNSKVIKIDGPSAGAVITALIIAGLTDKVLNDSVLVTGAINPNGSIGQVGSIGSKTDAAIGFGAHELLVPQSQEFKSSNIFVIGVSGIQQVMKYLTVSS